MPQLWFADDGVFMTDDMSTLQLTLDTLWMGTRIAGLNLIVKEDGSKTAWQGSYWAQRGRRRADDRDNARKEERQVEGWVLRLPTGAVVPQVSEYKHLGSEEGAEWEGSQRAVREKVVKRCTQMMRLIGQLGVLSREQLRMALALAVEGNVGYYARATVLRMEECDRIEAVRAEVLRARGLEAGGTSIPGTIERSRNTGRCTHADII